MTCQAPEQGPLDGSQSYSFIPSSNDTTPSSHSGGKPTTDAWQTERRCPVLCHRKTSITSIGKGYHKTACSRSSGPQRREGWGGGKWGEDAGPTALELGGLGHVSPTP